MLRKLRYRADLAANGEDVLQALERQPYDLILMWTSRCSSWLASKPLGSSEIAIPKVPRSWPLQPIPWLEIKKNASVPIGMMT